MSRMLVKPDLPLFVLGDFNVILDPAIDKHLLAPLGLYARGTALSRLLAEMGWFDIWRLKNLVTRCVLLFF